MKKLMLLPIIVLGICLNLSGQKALYFHCEKINDSRIYLILNGDEIEYFTQSKTEDGKTKMRTNQEFTLKDGNYCNIYMRWLNPLRYNITWKDSLYLDERDKSVKDFVDLLTFQFGTSVTSLGQKGGDFSTLKQQPMYFQIPDPGFRNLDLTNLFVHLNSFISYLTEEDRKMLNELLPILLALDKANDRNICKEVDSVFEGLFAVTDPDTARIMADSCRKNIAEYENYFKDGIVRLSNLVIEKMKEHELQDPLLKSLTTLSINKFLIEVNTSYINNKKLVNKLNPVVEIIEGSVSDRSINPGTGDFFRIKNLSFEPGEKFETALTLSEFRYESETKEFIKEKNITERKMTFSMYDPVIITVSTGIFYSKATLKGYGIATGSAGEMTVTEDDITKNNPVTAVFLNFNFGKGSRYFVPLTQIGIDPTKKRPFLLMGAGFSIPVAKIAFSAGPVWTWNPSLDKLSVGQSIVSTTALENDIKYEFDVQPKGWYLGIQYNF
jgi:hypothetical protein